MIPYLANSLLNFCLNLQKCTKIGTEKNAKQKKRKNRQKKKRQKKEEELRLLKKLKLKYEQE